MRLVSITLALVSVASVYGDVGNPLQVHKSHHHDKSDEGSSATNTTVITSPEPKICPKDMFLCPDGQMIGRNPENDCKFFACEEKAEENAPEVKPVMKSQPHEDKMSSSSSFSSNITTTSHSTGPKKKKDQKSKTTHEKEEEEEEEEEVDDDDDDDNGDEEDNTIKTEEKAPKPTKKHHKKNKPTPTPTPTPTEKAKENDTEKDTVDTTSTAPTTPPVPTTFAPTTTAPAKAPVNSASSASKRGSQAVVRHNGSRKQGNNASWVAIDDAVPPALHDAVFAAFNNYNRTCEKLALEISAAEKQMEDNSNQTIVHREHKTRKHNSTIAENEEVYHIVVDLNCTVKDKLIVSGQFVLKLAQQKSDRLQLEQCGRRDEHGKLISWITVSNGELLCQTPREREEYESQPLHYTKHDAVLHTSEGTSFMTNMLADKSTLAVAGAASVAFVILVIVVAVMVGRNQRTSAPSRSVLDDAESSDGNTADAQSPSTNDLDSTKAATESETKGLMNSTTNKSTEEEGSFMNDRV